MLCRVSSGWRNPARAIARLAAYRAPMPDQPDEQPASERPLSELDDTEDRDELRDRFEILLQEFRVVLPGVQILFAFLLTAPFSARFAEIDRRGRVAYGIALVAATVSVLALMTPTILHRLGDRQERVARLRWSIRLLVLGIATLTVSLLAALWAISRLVFTGSASWWIFSVGALAAAMLFGVVPFAARSGRAGTHR